MCAHVLLQTFVRNDGSFDKWIRKEEKTYTRSMKNNQHWFFTFFLLVSFCTGFIHSPFSSLACTCSIGLGESSPSTWIELLVLIKMWKLPDFPTESCILFLLFRIPSILRINCNSFPVRNTVSSRCIYIAYIYIHVYVCRWMSSRSVRCIRNTETRKLP